MVRERISYGLFLMWAILLCACSSVADVQGAVKEYEKQKTVTRSFDVSAGDQLSIDNRYGNITITHWNKKQVEIRVVVESRARREADAQRNLDRIQIELEKRGGWISGITTLRSDGRNSGRNQSFEINYFIQMPANLPSDLVLKYGNIFLPNNQNGRMRVDLKYGDLKGGDFSDQLDLEVKYGNVRLGKLAETKLELGYGKIRFTDASAIRGELAYSDLEARNIDEANLDMRYSDLDVDSADRLILDMRYGDGHIGRLNNRLDMSELAYTDLEIDHVNPDFERIDISASYADLTIGIPASASFKAQVSDMRYASFKVNGLKVTSQNRTDHDYAYEVNGGRRGEIRYDGGGYSDLTLQGR